MRFRYFLRGGKLAGSSMTITCYMSIQYDFPVTVKKATTKKTLKVGRPTSAMINTCCFLVSCVKWLTAVVFWSLADSSQTLHHKSLRHWT